VGCCTPRDISNMSFMISLTGASGIDMYTEPTVIMRYSRGTMLPAYLDSQLRRLSYLDLSTQLGAETHWTSSYRSARWSLPSP
jgi:hypothetical protein